MLHNKRGMSKVYIIVGILPAQYIDIQVVYINYFHLMNSFIIICLCYHITFVDEIVRVGEVTDIM